MPGVDTVGLKDDLAHVAELLPEQGRVRLLWLRSGFWLGLGVGVVVRRVALGMGSMESAGESRCRPWRTLSDGGALESGVCV